MMSAMPALGSSTHASQIQDLRKNEICAELEIVMMSDDTLGHYGCSLPAGHGDDHRFSEWLA
jgi:hypothetical protein